MGALDNKTMVTILLIVLLLFCYIGLVVKRLQCLVQMYFFLTDTNNAEKNQFGDTNFAANYVVANSLKANPSNVKFNLAPQM